MIGKLIVGCGVAIACLEAARPANWWHVAEAGVAPNRIEQFVDESSIRTNGAGNRIVAVAMVLEHPRSSGLSGMEGVYEVNCRKGLSRSLGRVGVTAAGAPLGGDRRPLGWQRHKAGSFAAVVSGAICQGMPSDAVEIGDIDPDVVSRIYFSERSR